MVATGINYSEMSLGDLYREKITLTEWLGNPGWNHEHIRQKIAKVQAEIELRESLEQKP